MWGALLVAPLVFGLAAVFSYSVGASFGKPIAPQTASVGVSTTAHVRREGDVIRFNLPWTFALLAYLLLTALLFALFLPHVIQA